MMSISKATVPRILYDVSVLGADLKDQRGRTGVYRVVDEIARYLAKQSSIDLNWSAFGNPDHLFDIVELLKQDSKIQRPLVAYLNLRRITDTLSAPIDYLEKTHLYPLVRPVLPWVKQLREKATFNRHLLQDFDLVHSPFHSLPEIDKRRPYPVRVLTVYDLSPIKFPQFYDARNAQRTASTLNSLTSEDWVLCISESTRNDLLQFRPDLKPEQTRVTPLAAADHFRAVDDRECIRKTKERLGIPQDASYFLSVCTLEPRKNLGHLLSVFRQVRSEFDAETYLVLVGAKGWKIDNLINELAASTAEKVIVTGYVADEDLAPIYSGAVAFVYPSLFEGFGLPTLEAMQCGTPVITSNNSSLPEVVGDAGILVPADSVDDLANAMIRVYRNPDFRSQLIRAGHERAKRFSWDRCGQLTLETYLNALEARG